jgi:hypothetical protein
MDLNKVCVSCYVKSILRYEPFSRKPMKSELNFMTRGITWTISSETKFSGQKFRCIHHYNHCLKSASCFVKEAQGLSDRHDLPIIHSSMCFVPRTQKTAVNIGIGMLPFVMNCDT